MAAEPYANHTAGWSPVLTMSASGITDLQFAIARTLVALHICGGRSSVADALPRFVLRVVGRDLFPECQFRENFREMGRRKRGRMDTDTKALGSGDTDRYRTAPSTVCR